jgi:FOG: HPt domain
MPIRITPEEIAKHIDLKDGLNRVRNNKALFKHMLELFAAGKDFEMLEKAIAEKNYREAENIAHTIKGTSGNLGLVRIFQLSADLVLRLREDIYPEALSEEFKEAVEITLACIEAVLAELV